jgi:hypothetical protein
MLLIVLRAGAKTKRIFFINIIIFFHDTRFPMLESNAAGLHAMGVLSKQLIEGKYSYNVMFFQNQARVRQGGH